MPIVRCMTMPIVITNMTWRSWGSPCICKPLPPQHMDIHSLTCSHDMQAHTYTYTHTHSHVCTTYWLTHTLCCKHTPTCVQLNTLILTLLVPVEVLWHSLSSLLPYVTVPDEATLTFRSVRKDQCTGACWLKNAPGGESLPFVHMIHS